MNKKILPSVFSVFFLFLITCCFSQDYDLIITTKGDSIACCIDSITKTYIYFEMKRKSKWVQTYIGLTDVSDYNRNAIDKKQFVFKAGTSIIDYPKPTSRGSIRDIQKNSIYVGTLSNAWILSLSYARMIPGGRGGINLAGGLSFIGTDIEEGVIFMGEISILTGGGTKHFFEPGILMLANSSDFGILVRAGYRYQGPDGFLFRPGIYYAGVGEGGVFMGIGAALSIGYSFKIYSRL